MTRKPGSGMMPRAIRMPRPMNLQSHPASGDVTTATPTHETLARWLVAAEGGSKEEPPADSASAARVFAKLSQRVARLITPVGSEALIRRAVHLSRSEFPFLATVQVGPSPAAVIDRLIEAAATTEVSQGSAGLVRVLATLVALLESFIGQDLTFRVLRDVWPELPALTTPHSPPGTQ